MKSRSTKTIGVIVGNVKNTFFGEILDTIESRLQKSGFHMIVCNTNEDPEIEHYNKIAEQYLLLLDQCDNDEINNTGINLSREEIESKIEGINKRLAELEVIKEYVKENGSIYVTDPDSRMMKTNNNGVDICHNVQIVADDKNHLVVAVDVTSDPVDKEQFHRMALQAKEEMGAEKAKEYRLNEFKGKTFCIIPQRKPLIMDTIAQIGLTDKDVKFMNFGDDQKAATAFLSGTGDYYIGSLPQQQKLVKMEDKFVDAGGSDILGPAGLWYDTMISTDRFMKDNCEAALRTIATMYATIKEFDKDPGKFAEIASKKLSEIAGAKFTVEDYLEFQTRYDDFLSIEECKEGLYNKGSSLYWKHPVDYYVKLSIADGLLDKEISNDEYYGEGEKLFFELLQRDDLMKLINER